jgi:hypothetical protein
MNNSNGAFSWEERSINDSEKVCTKCLTERPLAAFSKQSRSPDGHQPICKACNKLYSDSRREEVNRHYREVYYPANREWLLANQKASRNRGDKPWPKRSPEQKERRKLTDAYRRLAAAERNLVKIKEKIRDLEGTQQRKTNDTYTSK